MPYLVDGNNLAHVMGLAGGGLADRDACARVVSDFCRSHGARATIVFDGPPPQGTAASHPQHRVRLEFSGSLTADEVILRFLRVSKSPRDFTLVTSDKSLGDQARHRGATVERAHEFVRRIGRADREPGPRKADKPGRRETAAEIEAWLTIFDPKRGQKPLR